MLRVALQPRYLGLLALMVAATVVCGLLASWQWDRAHRAITTRTEAAQTVSPLTEALQPGEPVTNALVGRTVEATGTFAAEEQVLVPGRRIDGTDAVLVVTALHVPQADGTIARLPVVRGWLPEADVRGADGALDAGAIPAAPTGEVQVRGRLEASESATSGVEDGAASEIATPMLLNEWGGPMYYGFVAVPEPDAASGLRGMPAGQSAFSAGLDWQNIGYSLQWVLFAGFFLYLWWRSVRTGYLDEQADRRAALAARLESTGADAADGSSAARVGDARAPGADQPAGDPAAPESSLPAGQDVPDAREREENGADSAPAR